MRLELSKTQADLVHSALEDKQRALREEMNAKPPSQAVLDLISPQLFQLELLVTWFDRQKELQG